MIQMLMAMPVEDYDLSNLRSIASGTSPLPIEVMRSVERRIPGVKVREGYGLTETSAIISAMPPDDIRHRSGRQTAARL